MTLHSLKLDFVYNIIIVYNNPIKVPTSKRVNGNEM